MKLSLEIILLLPALIILLPSLVFFIECLAASQAKIDHQAILENDQEANPRVTVLVPAHNEADAISSTIESILPQLTSTDQLIVIADNCTDTTAQAARQYPIIVIERFNIDQRGKGYALDYGLKYLEKEPPEILITVDADCFVESNTIKTIACLAHQKQRPVQSTYLMEHPINPTVKDLISAFAIKVKNLVRPIGLAQLGQPCLLTGSGMAFPWSVIRQVSLTNSKTTDDMQLSVDLALAGYSPFYCPQGRVKGRLMADQWAASQRSRWEHGHIEMILTETPRLLKAFREQKRLDLLALALEISVPPLSLLVLLWCLMLIITLIGGLLGLSWLPSGILAVAGLMIMIGVFAAWFKFARTEIPLSTLRDIVRYLIWKIPIYFAYLNNPKSRWLETERDKN
ncbi:glycosyltransferase family 2 protein [Chroococcus sp. FPU101]|uniref:glycosyltransferase family 2 protein n=1 Tax=Chroococcus sp. FPU101 TaxID=1974212 RepID=UPI001A8DA0FC|nr:glycosyltransferase family 2 protein [Chroococcus sp. FPU101]GFE69235.1 glycosyl transferase family 2 [Chroococcus sp. FPU101]